MKADLRISVKDFNTPISLSTRAGAGVDSESAFQKREVEWMLLNPFGRPNKERIIGLDSLVDKWPQTPGQNDANRDQGMFG